MNYNQKELFQNVLETMEAQLHDKLNHCIERRCYDAEIDNPDFCLDMLKRIARMLEDIDSAISRDDMESVVEYLFGIIHPYSGERFDIENGTDYIESVNATYGVCTDEEVEALIEELLI